MLCDKSNSQYSSHVQLYGPFPYILLSVVECGFILIFSNKCLILATFADSVSYKLTSLTYWLFALTLQNFQTVN